MNSTILYLYSVRVMLYTVYLEKLEEGITHHKPTIINYVWCLNKAQFGVSIKSLKKLTLPILYTEYCSLISDYLIFIIFSLWLNNAHLEEMKKSKVPHYFHSSFRDIKLKSILNDVIWTSNKMCYLGQAFSRIKSNSREHI